VIDNPFYSHEFHGDYDLVSVGRLDLEEGEQIPDCQLAVATFGELSAARDNAILITSWYSGTHQTWRDVYIGPEHALNPQRYFIVAVNQIGSGLSTSPHNAGGANAGIAMSKFPRVRIGDDVVAQERLLREHFGIERLALVTGGSMGAQQTYEWAVRFPDRVLRAAPIAGTAQNTPHDFLLAELTREALMSDPGWNGGEYASSAEVAAGLIRQAHVWAVVGLSTEFWKQEAWRGLGFDSRDAFLTGFLEPLLHRHGPQRPADPVLEVAARRRGPARRRRSRRGPGPGHGQDLRHAHRRGSAVPGAGLRTGASDDLRQRAAGDRGHPRSPGPVRRRSRLYAADRPPPLRTARDPGLKNRFTGSRV
jgi:homoserine O-acetyltransferase